MRLNLERQASAEVSRDIWKGELEGLRQAREWWEQQKGWSDEQQAIEWRELQAREAIRARQFAEQQARNWLNRASLSYEIALRERNAIKATELRVRELDFYGERKAEDAEPTQSEELAARDQEDRKIQARDIKAIANWRLAPRVQESRDINAIANWRLAPKGQEARARPARGA